MSAATRSAPEKGELVDEDVTTESTQEERPAARSLGIVRPGLGSGGLGGRRAWLVPVVLLLVAGVLAFLNARHAGTAEGATDARKTVVTHVEELLSYDYREIEDDLASEADWLTGSFADEYQDLVRDKIAPAAVKAQVVTDAEVSASGVVSSERHSVELLLFVNVTTRSSELADAKTAGSRLVVQAEWVDGAWRISSLQPV